MTNARDQLDADISRYISVEKLLRYMASETLERSKKSSELETVEMIELAAHVVDSHRKNLEHVRATYDAMVSDSMPSEKYP